MRKFMIGSLSLLLLMAGSAFVEKGVTVLAAEVCLDEPETEVYSSQQKSSTYSGQAIGLGTCAWGLQLCSENIILLVDRTGVNPVVGNFYKITVGERGNCGSVVTSIQSTYCEFP